MNNNLHLPPLNEKLIGCVLEHIESHPEEWDQSDWLTCRGQVPEWCGTTGCFAGWAVALSTPAEQWPPSQKGESIRTQAARLLGITNLEADYLFAGSNTMQDIKHRLDVFRRARSGEGTKGDVK